MTNLTNRDIPRQTVAKMLFDIGASVMSVVYAAKCNEQKEIHRIPALVEKIVTCTKASGEPLFKATEDVLDNAVPGTRIIDLARTISVRAERIAMDILADNGIPLGDGAQGPNPDQLEA